MSRCFRPAVQELEARLTPSGSSHGHLLSHHHSHHHRHHSTSIAVVSPQSFSMLAVPPGQHGRVAPQGQQTQAQPTAVIDFSQLPANAAYTLYVKLVAQDGTSFTDTYNIQAGTTQQSVRDLVFNSIPAGGPGLAGWLVSTSGTTAITIKGHYPAQGNISPIQNVGAVGKGLKDNQQPAVSGTSGVKPGQTTNGTDWKFSFLPSPIDGTSTIQQNAVVQAVIDGTTITANVTTGQTTSQVASALYTAMQNAGISGATLSGSTIDFLDNPSGQEAINVSLQFTGSSGGSAVSWIEADLIIAQRNILS